MPSVDHAYIIVRNLNSQSADGNGKTFYLQKKQNKVKSEPDYENGMFMITPNILMRPENTNHTKTI